MAPTMKPSAPAPGRTWRLRPLQLQAIGRALEPGAALWLVFAPVRSSLPGHAGSSVPAGHVGQQLVCERAWASVRKQVASEYEHRHDGLPRYLRCECAGNLGHFWSGPSVATLRLAPASPVQPCSASAAQKLRSNSWRLLAQRTRARVSGDSFAGVKLRALSRKRESCCQPTLSAEMSMVIGFDMDEK